MFQDCTGANIGCRIIKCKLKFLKKSDYVSVKITSTLVEATFETVGCLLIVLRCRARSRGVILMTLSILISHLYIFTNLFS